MEKNPVNIIAFYLPQFYINDLNNRIWGEGFTEWTNVAQARPNFEGHYQPHIPGALGFYDLSDERNISKQISLAKSFGVYGFCFYYYWFDGKRALDVPLDKFLDSKEEFPFCICWANENWSRKWDGGNDEIILHQTYGTRFEEEFIQSVEGILSDRRYIKIKDKPVLLIYRPGLFPDTHHSVARIREAARQRDLGELYLLAVDFYVGEKQINEWGFDGIVEFPPHQFYDQELLVDNLPGKILNTEFKGHLIDYRKMILRAVNKWRKPFPIKRYRGVIPSWDNTARRKNTPLTVCHSSPEFYKLWLEYALSYSKYNNSEFVFINAWNEWGEGCHIEPDRATGYKYLQATKAALIDYGKKDYNTTSLEVQKLVESSLSHYCGQTVTPNTHHIEKPEVISLKDFLKSRLFKYPKLYKILRAFYHNFLN